MVHCGVVVTPHCHTIMTTGFLTDCHTVKISPPFTTCHDKLVRWNRCLMISTFKINKIPYITYKNNNVTGEGISIIHVKATKIK